VIHLIGVDPLPGEGGNGQYTKEQIEWFFPRELQGRIKADPFKHLSIDYKELSDSPWLSFHLDSNLTKQQLRNQWADHLEQIEQSFRGAGDKKFSIFFATPKDDRGIYTIQIWKD